MNVLEVDHVAVAVNSIPEALKLYLDTLGGEFISGGDGPNDDMRTVQLKVGGLKLELMQPLGDDSYLQRFIDKHGQGFHHMTIFVEDLYEAIASLEGQATRWSTRTRRRRCGARRTSGRARGSGR